ncbi:Nn.00g028290.m01.CDS01 [Neocucurbitaria sp. VM-36]
MTQDSPLLTLPGELRNHIVEYAFRREPGSAPPPLPRSPLALSSTCRQLYNEFQALARSSTIFSIHWSSAQDLRIRASKLSSSSRYSIKKLQLFLPRQLEDLFIGEARRKRVKNFDFTEAGLTGIQELYFRYPPTDAAGEGVGVTGREYLMLALWKILWERGNEKLSKVCAVHDGTQPYLCLTLLNGMMKEFGPLRRSRRWELWPDLDHGKVHFVMKGHDGARARQVTLVVGYSFHEAENYCEVREQLLMGKHAEILVARRADCAHVKPFSELSDGDIKREVLALALLFRDIDGPSMVARPHIDAIRDMSRIHEP